MELVIRKGTMADTEGFIRLLRDVRDSMAHKEWFYLDPPEDVKRMMAEGIMQMWVVMDGERMVAAFDILIPNLEPDNYGYDLGLSREELLKVVHMDSVAVHTDYRGRGLQRQLLQTAEAEVASQGSHILLCTIHPDNTFSLQNALKEGYAIQKKLEKYGSVRYVLRKDIL